MNAYHSATYSPGNLQCCNLKKERSCSSIGLFYSCYQSQHFYNPVVMLSLLYVSNAMFALYLIVLSQGRDLLQPPVLFATATSPHNQIKSKPPSE